LDNLGCQGLSCRSLLVSFRCRELGPQDFENHPTLVVIDQCKYMRAAFAQPVVLETEPNRRFQLRQPMGNRSTGNFLVHLVKNNAVKIPMRVA